MEKHKSGYSELKDQTLSYGNHFPIKTNTYSIRRLLINGTDTYTYQ